MLEIVQTEENVANTIVYTVPCRRQGCVSLELLRQPDVKGREILRGGAHIIMLAAAASCVSPRLCLRHFDIL